MTEEQFLDYCEEVHAKIRQFKTWRRGQAYMNVLAHRFPDIEEEVRATDIDPFYDDEKVPYLLQFLMKLVVIDPPDEEEEDASARRYPDRSQDETG